jgi:hypothetical protein
MRPFIAIANPPQNCRNSGFFAGVLVLRRALAALQSEGPARSLRWSRTRESIGDVVGGQQLLLVQRAAAMALLWSSATAIAAAPAVAGKHL